MTLVLINHVKLGMKIASSIEDDFGRIIIRKDEELTEEAIARLKMRGFHALDVNMSLATTAKNGQIFCFEPEIQTFDENLDIIFRTHQTDSLMLKIKQMTRDVVHEYYSTFSSCVK